MTLPSSPEGKIYKSSNNLKERINIYNFIRNSLIKISDGEYIDLDNNNSSEVKNLMSYIKIINLNPYSEDLNPYKDLPNNFMIYNSAFPVIKKDNSDIVELNKDNVGLNLRIYNIDKLEIGPIISFNYLDEHNVDAFLSNKVNNDIYFYNFVKNEIILKKICPHFCIIHGYFISSGQNINFRKLFYKNFNKLISLKRDKFFQENNLRNNSIYNEHDKIDMERLINSANRYFERINEPTIKYIFDKIHLDKKQNYYRLLITENNDIKNNLLLSLTEAPNLSIKNWYTNSYTYKDIKKLIKIMSNNGYHNTEVWESILFQLYYTLMIMIIKGIKINDFNLNNIFIKKITDNQKIYGYWIYNVNGIKFYIKNYGFLLLIDSNFKNKIEFNKNKNDINKRTHFNDENVKIIANFFEDFLNENIMNNDVKPFIDEIRHSLNRIRNFDDNNLQSTLITNIIVLFGEKFLHNKFGTNVDPSLQPKYIPPASGDIIRHNNKYSIFLELSNNNYIITKDVNNYLDVEINVPAGNQYVYINLEQNLLNDGSKLDFNNLLDTYILK
jgi:hypothetical protein